VTCHHVYLVVIVYNFLMFAADGFGQIGGVFVDYRHPYCSSVTKKLFFELRLTMHSRSLSGTGVVDMGCSRKLQT
jgi:hypothetical protein